MTPSPDSSLRDLLRAAKQALDGAGTALATSGSTGSAHQVALSAQALRASATATATRLGGHGSWLLALPVDHIAGWQVLVRSALAGTTPTRVDGPFTPRAFRDAAGRLTGPGLRYVSLVPTQLRRLAADPPALAALAAFDAVLIGGAALPGPLREIVQDAGVRLHRTYGMTETAGGCVYDGTPLDGVTVRLDEDGRVFLAGPVLATGYLDDADRTAERFHTDAEGTRWFRTDDVAEQVAGQLHLLGRVDDMVNSGGLKVAPRPVEEALLALDGVSEAVVLGVPDPEWGQRVAAVLVGTDAHTDTDAVRDLLRGRLPDHWLPRQVVWVEQLPLLPSGKPDRLALRHICAGGNDTMDGHPRS